MTSHRGGARVVIKSFKLNILSITHLLAVSDPILCFYVQYFTLLEIVCFIYRLNLLYLVTGSPTNSHLAIHRGPRQIATAYILRMILDV